MSYCKDIYDMLCKKYPNSNIYIISDHHFGHNNIINYTRSEFSDIESMHSHIIEEHNKAISDDDIVIFLGDFSFRTSIMKEVLPKLKGHKYLILGNHDQGYIMRSYPSFGLEGVYNVPVKLNGDYLSHEPLLKDERNDAHFKLVAKEFAKASGINYHGHIHTEERLDETKFKNVTCEALDYKPLLIGKTHELSSDSKELFINSPYFSHFLNDFCNSYQLNSRLILKDYLYSLILDLMSKHNKEFFIQGSFGLYKKYGFISDFSDLDMSYLFDPRKSKNVNIAHMKKLIDETFESLKDIDGINLAFYKRYSSLRILEAIYTSKNPYNVKCYIDSNLVFQDSYRNTDFYSINGQSVLGTYLDKTSSSLRTDYILPEFTTQVIVPEADIANLILQILFQKDLGSKKPLVLKKLQYLYKLKFDKNQMKNFEDIFTRFFLRNIALLSTLCRYDEIKYIQDSLDEFPYLLELLPENIKNIISNMIKDSGSIFMDSYREIANIDTREAFDKSGEIIKKIKGLN